MPFNPFADATPQGSVEPIDTPRRTQAGGSAPALPNQDAMAMVHAGVPDWTDGEESSVENSAGQAWWEDDTTGDPSGGGWYGAGEKHQIAGETDPDPVPDIQSTQDTKTAEAWWAQDAETTPADISEDVEEQSGPPVGKSLELGVRDEGMERQRRRPLGKKVLVFVAAVVVVGVLVGVFAVGLSKGVRSSHETTTSARDSGDTLAGLESEYASLYGQVKSEVADAQVYRDDKSVEADINEFDSYPRNVFDEKTGKAWSDDLKAFETRLATDTAHAESKKAEAEEKERRESLTTLNAEVTAASALLSSSDGKTADNVARQALTTEIQAAQKVAKDTTKHATDYSAEVAKLKAAEKAVSDAVAAKTKADQAAATAAHADASRGSSGPGGGYSGSNGSGSGGSSSGAGSGGSSGSTGGSAPPSWYVPKAPPTEGNLG